MPRQKADDRTKGKTVKSEFVYVSESSPEPNPRGQYAYKTVISKGPIRKGRISEQSVPKHKVVEEEEGDEEGDEEDDNDEDEDDAVPPAQPPRRRKKSTADMGETEHEKSGRIGKGGSAEEDSEVLGESPKIKRHKKETNAPKPRGRPPGSKNKRENVQAFQLLELMITQIQERNYEETRRQDTDAKSLAALKKFVHQEIKDLKDQVAGLRSELTEAPTMTEDDSDNEPRGIKRTHPEASDDVGTKPKTKTKTRTTNI